MIGFGTSFGSKKDKNDIFDPFLSKMSTFCNSCSGKKIRVKKEQIPALLDIHLGFS